MALFAGKLKDEIADLEEDLEIAQAVIDGLREAAATAMASHLNEIALRDERVKTLIADHATQMAFIKGENAVLDRDASRWRSIWPHGTWVRITTVEGESGDQLHVFQPKGGRFSEGSIFGARILTDRRDLFD